MWQVRRSIEDWASEEGADRAEAYSLVDEMRAVVRREREGKEDAEDALRLEIRMRKVPHADAPPAPLTFPAVRPSRRSCARW